MQIFLGCAKKRYSSAKTLFYRNNIARKQSWPILSLQTSPDFLCIHPINGTRLLYYGSVIVEEHYSVIEYFAIVNSNTRLKGHLYEKIVGNPNIGWL